MASSNNHLVIMAGGIGSRFWPQSRVARPKQFVDFFGMGKSLLQQTYERFARIIPRENIIVSTHSDYSGLVREQLPELAPEQILHEPAHKGTAPSMAFVAYHIRSLNPEANIVMAPSDQVIMDEERFAEDMHAALAHVAKHDCLLTVGIRPTRPETRYGYIQISHEAEEGFSKVKTFTEKPEYEFARIFVESGEFYWNTGLFVWNVNSIINTMTQMLPEMSARLNTIFCQEPDRDKRRAALYECYESFPNISVDYAILEHSDEIYVFPADFGWSDLGTWGSLHVQMEKDIAGNVAIGPDITLYESRGCVVHTMQEKKVVIIGLENCIVAENDNHLLICKLEDEQRIKEFADK